MKPTATSLTQKFGIDDAERAQRMAYVHFDDRDVALLRGMLPMMEQHVQRIVDEFYEHLLKHKAARAFFPDEKMLSHVKATQREYLLDLCRANFDNAYAERRLQIGVVHERIGLVPKWYLGSYSNFFGLILPLIMRRYWWRPAQCARCIMALIKIMNLDQQLVMDTYIGSVLEKLQGLGVQVEAAVEVVVSSASAILTSTAQLACNAAETAAAINETTVTMEEVKQTSQHSSQKAKAVAEESQKAAAVARGGKQAVDQTIAGMNDIRQQMAAVAESILSLSAQSQAIGEIISTVDDLAAQSKLLAVNAAIEAAKAGEEGKGFAVVAQEVKSLAEQSKAATTQVRGILSDIQKATSSAVQATEQGRKTVEAGVLQSNSAGGSISSLAENISAAAQAATQIAATSQQQFTGMDQVALAMENIKQSSTQTVDSTRQAEAAAQQLHELGQKLKQLVSQFKA